jgi:transposase-like protein
VGASSCNEAVLIVNAQLGFESSCWEGLEWIRWRDEPQCSFCSSRRVHFLRPRNGVSRKTHGGYDSPRRIWKCGECRRQFSALTGTPLQGCRVPADKIVRAMGVLDRFPEVSCRSLAESVGGLTEITALRLRERIHLWNIERRAIPMDEPS